ncbi:MAG: NAD-dependent epimerase/dehydratase family protein [Deltaproteobacteria bacterium]|nr:NAD-dependent epimerase/dehydratase family protein [Deltaproteobacteria bacterium]
MGLQAVVTGERLLITGCSGFVGKSLAKRSLEAGWAVRGTVRSASSVPDLPAGVEPVAISDIGPGTDWSYALDGVAVVVHLAARAHQPHNSSRGAHGEYLRINTAGTARLARCAADAGVRRLLLLSTIKVNGEGGARPYTEKDPEDPREPYAVSKAEAEHILREISCRTGLESVILRPPLVYGPGVKANFLRLIRLVEERIPLPFGSLVNQRSMLFLGNLINAILLCLKNPNAGGKTYLVADNEIVSTPHLIREIASQLGMKPKLYPCPPAVLIMAARIAGRREEADRLLGSLWADTSKIRQELGWKPEYSFRQGLKTTIDWYCATGSAGTRVGKPK